MIDFLAQVPNRPLIYRCWEEWPKGIYMRWYSTVVLPQEKKDG